MASTTHKFLLIFVHGFKGSDKTFMELPDRLAHNMSSINVNSVPEIYPSYETYGDLNKAVEIFCRWLEEKVEEHEKNGETVWVCLLGHSMGGILAADAILRFKNLPGKKPKILGLIAYDTPFYGLNKNAFNDAYTRTVDYTEKMGNAASFLSSGAMLAHSFWSNKTTAKDANSSTRSVTVEAEAGSTKSTKNYGKWAMGVAAVTAVGALTYMHKETLAKSMGKGMEWVNSHMEFVGVLVKDRELKERVEKFKDPHLIFHCFYVYIPTKKRDDPPRTFIQLPAPQMRGYFSPYECTVDNEIEAHMSMFDPEKNHNYHVLVTRTVNFLNKMAASVES